MIIKAILVDIKVFGKNKITTYIKESQINPENPKLFGQEPSPVYFDVILWDRVIEFTFTTLNSDLREVERELLKNGWK